jgi:DNA-binding transcriptional MocR family regulator
VLEQSNRKPIAAAIAGWADHGHGSLSQRLAYGLRRLIDAGLLAPGATLPPERTLAAELAVSRSTVTAALDLLRSEGLLTSRQGRGTFVAGAADADADGEASNRMAVHLVEGAGGIDLAVGNPADVSHLPPISIDIADLLASGAGPGFQPLGLPSLRAAIAELYTVRGLHTGADEVHVTSGAHQAISLAIAALAGRRQPIAAETPGYPGFFDILEGLGHPLAPLRADRAGIVPESLDDALTRGGANVVYVQAAAQNPTGVVTPPARLRALAAVLDEHDAIVIEDATLADLVFAGRPNADLARLCRRATVVSVGSFSKVLWAGLRVGWMRGPTPVMDRTLHRRLALDLGPASPSQLLALGLLPHLDTIAAARREFLAAAVARGAAHLRAEIPEWHVPEPEGGSALWVDTGLRDTEALVQVAHRHGVHLAPGSIAVEGRRPDPHLRICVDRPWPLVEVGIRRIGAAWRDLTRGRTPIAG